MRARTASVLGLFSVLLYAQSDSALADHFRRGQAAAAQLDYDRAIAEFQAVLKIDPTVVQAQANLGLMYYSTGEYGKAANYLSQAARSDPGLLPAQLFLGLSDLKLGNAREAVPALRNAARLDPNNVEAARGLLACYVTLGNYGPAFQELQLFSQRDDEQSLFIAGQAYLDIGRALTKQLAFRYRDSAWAHELAGDLSTDRKDVKTAADEYAKARSLNSSVTESKAPMSPGDLAAQLKGPQTPEVLYRAIRAATLLGEQYFEKLQQTFPDSAFSHQLRGDVYRLRQDFPSALAEFQAAVQKRPDDAALHQSVGEMCIQLHRLNEAKHELQEAAKLNHSNGETKYLLGQVFTKENELDTAAEYLRQALQLDPDLLQARALLGTTYMHLGKPAQAVPQLEKAAALDYYGDLHFQLYRAYKAMGKAALADKALAMSKQLREKSLNAAVAKIGEAETLESPATF